MLPTRPFIFTTLVALLGTGTACDRFERDHPAPPIATSAGQAPLNPPEFVLPTDSAARDVGLPPQPRPANHDKPLPIRVATIPLPIPPSPEAFGNELIRIFEALAPRPVAARSPAPAPREPNCRPASRAPATTPAQVPTQSKAERTDSSRVIVYGANWCSACASIQKRLKARQVPFAYIDIEDKRALATSDGARITEKPASLRNVIPFSRVVQNNGQVAWVEGDGAESVERAYRGTASTAPIRRGQHWL